ncbi:hypothetical protein FACS1894122_12500 [Alphaproteobacteria bacterium]|nr:hypothetical protein FACS1894122_12500 [Alphaproteobacteria bacterium]
MVLGYNVSNVGAKNLAIPLKSNNDTAKEVAVVRNKMNVNLSCFKRNKECKYRA